MVSLAIQVVSVGIFTWARRHSSFPSGFAGEEEAESGGVPHLSPDPYGLVTEGTVCKMSTLCLTLS